MKTVLVWLGSSLGLAVTGGSLCMAQTSLTVVAAPDANYLVAPNSLVSMYAANIAAGVFVASDESPTPLPTTLGGVSATITDVAGHTLPIQLIAVTSGQVNAILPSPLQPGYPAVVNLTTSNGVHLTDNVTISAAAPSLFTADESGGWLAAAEVVVAHADASQTFMPAIATCTSNLVWNGMTWSGCVPIPINLGSSTDEAVLELFGTGIRGANSVAALCPGCGYAPVSVYVGPAYNQSFLTVLYAGAQAGGAPGSFYGLDQVNVVLPHWLAGAGVTSLTVTGLAAITDGGGEGADSNTVYVDIQ